MRQLGATLAQRWRYPDHHAYTERELRSIADLRGGLPLVTTFKDFVRLPENWRELLTGEVLVLGIRLDILKGRNVWIDTLDSLAKDAAEAIFAVDYRGVSVSQIADVRDCRVHRGGRDRGRLTADIGLRTRFFAGVDRFA